jgi:FHS family L-fucose permease-like MFS transporter
MSENKSGIFIVNGQSLAFTFALVSSLFFVWAVCNGMIDAMDKHFQEELSLSKSQSAWVQFAHYLGYFLMSMPAGWLATKLGYKRGIIMGLLIVAVGGFWFIPATHISEAASLGSVSRTTAFIGFLAGVCVIATGLTFLETIANPYTTVLGDKRFAATRINLAQSCNGLGWIFGPPLGAIFFYGKDALGHSTGSQTLYIPYVGVAIAALFLASIFAFAKMPDIKAKDDYHLDDAAPGATHSIWSHPHFVLGVAAQFFYVAAQAGIFSFFINYMTSETPSIPASWGAPGFLNGWLNGWFETGRTGALVLSDKGAAYLMSVPYVCFFIGRFTGAGLLRRFSAHKMLGFYALMNVVMTLLVFFKLGWLSAVCVFLSYFFMSIMFPTIFALGIFGLGARAKKASSFIVMAIMGGAVLPKLMGAVADKWDMSRGFIVPMFCFAFVAFYGFNWSKFSKADSLQGSGPLVGH